MQHLRIRIRVCEKYAAPAVLDVFNNFTIRAAFTIYSNRT